MNWVETSNLAIEGLRANKLRAVLTMLGVVIGSACVVLVVTVALTGKKYISSQIEAVGSNIVFAGLEQSNLSRNVSLADQISLGDLDAIKEGIPQVVQVAGTNDMPMNVVAAGRVWPVSMVGVTEGFQQIRKLIILRGRYFDDADFSTVSKVCLVSEHLAQNALPAGDSVGQIIHVGELRFTVIGTFRERTGTFGESEIRTDSVLIPFPLIKYYVGDDFIVTLYAQADRADDVPLVTDEVRQILKSRHAPEADYNVQNLTSILQTAHNISLALTIVLLLIAMMALLISGIGIMNIMLVTVTERTREIGIRKAIGAQRREILLQFLIEAILISGIGALIGIGLAVAIPFVIETLIRFLPVPGGITIPISWLSVVLAFVVSCATGVLFGYLPAKKAASLQPVESLRYE
ncbi:MAG TPA: ABC transporter permease [Candidatus Acidoferrales bacterium]|nr:ABC transporter permease [Candidatus Acidoferrales bacterium]